MAYYGRLEDLRNEIGGGGRLKARLLRGLAYLRGLDVNLFSAAREGFREEVEISGREIYAVHQAYRPKPAEDAKFEAHRLYIDLQYFWSGCEYIYLAPLRSLHLSERYKPKSDIVFFRLTCDTGANATLSACARLRMGPGSLAVLYPSDAHAPSICCGGRCSLVVKTVVKVRV